MTCPDCLKLASRFCRYPSQQHWSWCEQADALRTTERAEALHFLAMTKPALTAFKIPDLPKAYPGIA